MMELTISSILEWTKLFVRDPKTAARLVKEAHLPLEVSIMMIVLAGVVSTAVSGVYAVMHNSPDILLRISETEVMSIAPIGPFGQGLFAVFSGVGMGYALFRVGRRFDGQGTLPEIMGITAVLQLAVTVIVVAQFVLGLILPIVGFVLAILATYVFFRSLGHTVNEGHGFGNMGKSAWVIIGSILALSMVTVAVFVMLVILGFGPESTIVPYSEGVS
ncbi:YIP1 family protein [Octadecabacter sp.]|nr:YIP1 family protein [Octadecabacter sp.]